jgi:LacI family transcriptional regulator
MDLAAAAGVSISTVSKVLNGRPGVSGEKRDEILRLAAEQNYKPRSSPRPATLIDIVIRCIDNPWATLLLEGAYAEASRAGVGLAVTVTRGRDLGNQVWLERVVKRRTDGLILAVSGFSAGIDVELSRLRIPYVLVDPIGDPPPGIPVVGATNYDGGRAAVDHLASLGHKDIAVIAGAPNLACSQERLDGFRNAMAQAGLSVPTDYILHGNFTIEGARKAAQRLFRLPKRPSAVFVASDLQALGVYQAADEAGLRIPNDLSVVGFDDSPLANWMIPKLTTVRQPLEDMTRQAVRILLDIINGNQEMLSTRLHLATSLVVRNSTAAPCDLRSRRDQPLTAPVNPPTILRSKSEKKISAGSIDSDVYANTIAVS